MRRVAHHLVVAALAVTAAACGADPDDRFGLRTPPERSSAEPLPELERRWERVARERATRRDAARMRPVLRRWSAALRRNDGERATRYFAVPAIVSQGQPLELETAAEVKAFNDALPCGVRLLKLRRAGRFLVGTFELTERPAHRCASPGKRIRVALVLRGRKIAEWRQVLPGSRPGAERTEDAPDRPPEKRA